MNLRQIRTELKQTMDRLSEISEALAEQIGDDGLALVKVSTGKLASPNEKGTAIRRKTHKGGRKRYVPKEGSRAARTLALLSEIQGGETPTIVAKLKARGDAGASMGSCAATLSELYSRNLIERELVGRDPIRYRWISK